MPTRRTILVSTAGFALLTAGWACGFIVATPKSEVLSTPPVVLRASPSSRPGPADTATPVGEFGLLPAATEGALPTAMPIVPGPPPAIPESRRLTLEYPATIRAGDSDVIRLTLEIDTLAGATPTAEVKGNVISGGTVEIPNLYQTHSVVAEADLDLAGVDFQPSGPVSETLLPGESATFRWSVHPTAPGTYRGTAWLFLIFTNKLSGEQWRQAISAQPVQIEATTLFGLGGDAARFAGGLGAVGGGVLGFPFADDLLKWLWNRIRRRG